MKPTHMRKLLQLHRKDDLRSGGGGTLTPYTTTTTYSPPHPISHPTNTTSSTIINPTTHFDSAMALTIIVLVTALFFMTFFSVYMRHLANNNRRTSTNLRLRRHPSLRNSSSSRLQTPKGGIDPSTVRSLPLIPYCGNAKHSIEECRICLGEFEVEEIVKLIPYCRHVFHPHCIDMWLLSNTSCPLCRSTRMIVKDDEEKCLGVVQGRVDEGSSHFCEGSTVEEVDTWRELGTLELRRTCSWTSLGDRMVLKRSTSF